MRGRGYKLPEIRHSIFPSKIFTTQFFITPTFGLPNPRVEIGINIHSVML
jgi:hypothetical protein